MSETKWTAGPWLASEDGAEVCPASGEKSFVEFCLIHGPWTDHDWYGAEEAKANAHLIAAAPELYSVLEAVATRLDLERRERGPDAVFPAAAMVDIALATLAKARGEA